MIGHRHGHDCLEGGRILYSQIPRNRSCAIAHWATQGSMRVSQDAEGMRGTCGHSFYVVSIGRMGQVGKVDLRLAVCIISVCCGG